MTSPAVPAPVTADDVDRARERLGALVRRTPVELSERLSELAGAPVWLKREDLQAVRSYKLRGAYLFLDSLDDARRAAGVVVSNMVSLPAKKPLVGEGCPTGEDTSPRPRPARAMTLADREISP